MKKSDLKKILNDHYTRYTVRTYTDPRKTGAIEIWLPGKIVSFGFGFKLELIRPVSFVITARRLPWWKNRIVRKKWLVD